MRKIVERAASNAISAGDDFSRVTRSRLVSQDNGRKCPADGFLHQRNGWLLAGEEAELLGRLSHEHIYPRDDMTAARPRFLDEQCRFRIVDAIENYQARFQD